MSDGREGGFIKLYRQVGSWPLWESMTAPQRMVWVELLLCANWKDDAFWYGAHRIDVRRGQLAHSETVIAKRAKVSRKVVRDTIAKLISEGAVRREKSPLEGQAPHIVTIVNYERYQGYDAEEGPAEGQERAKVGPGSGQGRALREEGEEGKKETFTLSLEAPNPPALAETKVRKLSAQQEAFDYWREHVWPRISPAVCPEPGKAVFIRLAALCKHHGLPEVQSAMERAVSLIAEDAWIRANLTLEFFVSAAGFARCLPRGGVAPVTKLRTLTADGPRGP